MYKLEFRNVSVRDDGYGLYVEGNSLKDIISTLLGTNLGEKKEFKCNCCDILIRIDPKPVSIALEDKTHIYNSVEKLEEVRRGELKKETTETDAKA